ncbi:MAG TPA: methyltransferase domain-containing protein [Nevskiaceae bacterium]|nr:methyltransferase domain-containing protein [Nevskiaceae bacterium]
MNKQKTALPMTEAPCIHCGHTATLLFQARDLNHHVDTADFNYFRCPGCRLIFLQPVPDNLGAYYDVAYPPYSIPGNAAELDRAAQRVRWRVDFLKRYAPAGGRLLEIGPSYGAFAYAAAQAGFRVDAIEMDARCCDFINKHVAGARAIHTSNVVDGLKHLDGGYVAIVLWHNLEHLLAPMTVLRNLVEQLAAGGVLLVATPNPDSLQFRMFGRHWVHLDAPRHVALIPPGLVDATLRPHGLVRECYTTTDPDGLALSRMSSDISLAYALGLPVENGLRKWLSRILRWVLRPAENSLQRGSAYTVVYRRPAR